MLIHYLCYQEFSILFLQNDNNGNMFFSVLKYKINWNYKYISGYQDSTSYGSMYTCPFVGLAPYFSKIIYITTFFFSHIFNCIF